MQSPFTENEQEEEQGDLVPPNALISSIIIGSIGGMIALAVPITIVLSNVSLYSAGSRPDASIQVDTLIVGLWCLGVIIDQVLAFLTGMVVGKIAVKRKLGFLAGALVGGITYLGLFLVHYIPGYPDTITPRTGSINIGAGLLAILLSIVLLAVSALIGGLMGLWGARLTTRRHPYYYSEEQE